MLHAGEVHCLACQKVVAAIQDHIGLHNQSVQQSGIGAFCNGRDAHVRVDSLYGLLRRVDLELTHSSQCVGYLALQVRGVHRIRVH